MNRLWYWAIIERHDGDRFEARLYDLPELVAGGASEDEAAANLKKSAMEYVRRHVEAGELLPQASGILEIDGSNLPLVTKFSRRVIAVDVPFASPKPDAK